MTPFRSVDELLRAIGSGDESAKGELFGVLYEELHSRAARLARQNPKLLTLQATALINEAYLRLVDVSDASFVDRDHFLACAARAMRHLLINRARDRKRLKAGGEWVRVTLGDAAEAVLAVESADQAFAIEEALAQMEASEPRAARVFELRYFTGLGADEIAELMGVTRRTVDRDWRYARAFLLAAIQ
jgi:RNA polymerase sigma factor (TIGR02999 family)